MMLFSAAIKSLNKLSLICTYNSGRKNISFNPVSAFNNLDLQLVTTVSSVTCRRRDLTRLSLIGASQFDRCPRIKKPLLLGRGTHYTPEVSLVLFVQHQWSLYLAHVARVYPGWVSDGRAVASMCQLFHY